LPYNLRPGVPDLAGFPRTAWLAAARRALAAAPSDLFGYPDPRGHPGLRETLASYLARVRGVRATPDQVLICSGFVQALSLLASTLRTAARARWPSSPTASPCTVSWRARPGSPPAR
jgi:GntR family transcriptional regulator/MocR family aminotransferase